MDRVLVDKLHELQDAQERLARNRGAFHFFAIIVSCLVISLVTLRALNTGITYDEAYTYLQYVKGEGLRLQLLNNHILNSLAILLADTLSESEYNEFIIRSPNIIAYAAYAYVAYLLSSKFKYRYFVFSLFISNYYLNEFFGLARGYGISAAAILCVCYSFNNWLAHFNIRSFQTSMIFLCIACLSNGICLYIAVPIVISFAIIIMHRKESSKYIHSKTTWYCLAVLFFTFLYVLVVSREGMPVYSSENFYSGVVLSIPYMFTNSSYVIFLSVFVVFLILIFGVVKGRSKNVYTFWLLGYAILSIISNSLLSRGFPINRAMLPVYPVLVMAVASSLDNFYVCNKQLARTVETVLVLFFALQFALKIDMHSTKDWSDNYRIRNDVYEYARNHDIYKNEDKFNEFIEKIGNPVAQFYRAKIYSDAKILNKLTTP